MSDIIKVEIPCKLAYEKVVREATAVLAFRVGFREKEIDELKIAVDEACSNAIQHSGTQGDKAKVMVTFNIIPSGLEIHVIDMGKGFDPSKVKSPFGRRLKSGGGRGIFIMKALMDEVTFDSQPGKGTTVKLIKFRKDKKED